DVLKKIGIDPSRLRSVSTVRAEATDEFHNTQLREKPDDPNVHVSYGAYLSSQKRDNVGAERAYRRALELNPKDVNALGNLALLFVERGDVDEADRLYRAALDSQPGNENVCHNYSRFRKQYFG